MKKLLALVLLCFLALPHALADAPRVIDEADVLSAADEDKLEQAISLIRDQYRFDVVLLTKTSIDGKVPRYYAADYYDYNGYGYGESKDGIILLLVTGAGVGNRDYTIVNTGRGEKIFSDSAMDAIEADMLPYLRLSDYPAGMARFVTGVEARLADYTPAKRAAKVMPVMLLIGLAVGAIAAFSLKFGMRTVRRKADASSYVRQGSFQLSRVQDLYLYTTTTRRKIETSSGGRGGGGFTGSSGTHHTSHSGKF